MRTLKVPGVQLSYEVSGSRSLMILDPGAADFGFDPEDDGFDLSALMYNIALPLSSAGCSAVYVPPSSTATDHGYLSRNFDFSIGSMADVMGLPLSPEEKAKLPPLYSEPYLMEWYPQDEGMHRWPSRQPTCCPERLTG